jgi:2'-hydroxyisoflavone reductase
VDTCGYRPEEVRASVRALADRVEQYLFVSSLSVYVSFATPGLDERARTYPAPPPDAPLDASTYGAFKAECEREAERVLPGRVLAVRAGALVGPRDDIGRLTYWIKRVACGGDLLAPGRAERRIQLVDARDVADWLVRMAEVRQSGAFNVTGPDRPLTFGALFDTIARVTGSDGRPVWAPDDFLLANGVKPWTELPFWLPEVAEVRAFFDVDVSRALASGLTFRPLDETIADTIDWAESHHGPEPVRDYGAPLEVPGLAPERERELLAALEGER